MRPLPRSWTIPCVAAVLAALACASTPWSVGAADLTRKQPYLVYPGNPAQMKVLWQLSATDTARIAWGTDTTYALGSVQTFEYGTDHQHAFTITGLTPGSRYEYRVTNEGVPHRGSFVAAPAPAASRLKFIAYGDTRTNPGIHNQVAARIVDTYTADPEFQSFALMVGDFVTNGSSSETDWDNEFFSPAYPSLRAFLAHMPYQGCTGNHEGYGPLYAKYFPFPFMDPYLASFGAGGRYWSFDYGPVHVTMVDQYDYQGYAPGSPQYEWIASDLAASSKPWKFICLHEPGWSSGRNNTTVQSALQPLCQQYGVSIVFGGHNHFYARAAVCGVQHITTGGGGAPLAEVDPGSPFLVAAASAYHFCKIAIDGDDLSFTVLAENGAVLDAFTLHKPPAGDWTITASAGAHGWICPVGLVSVVNGASQTFSIAPDLGYHIADVLVDGHSVGPVASYTFDNVTAPHTIAASFALNAYSLDISMVGCGTVTRSPDLPMYDRGTLVMLTAVPPPGFEFVGWDGDVISSQNPMGVNMNSSKTLIATFRPQVAVLAPNGGERIQLRDTFDIRWSAAGGARASVDLSFSTSGASGPYIPIATGHANTGSHRFVLTNPATTNAFIQIVATDSCACTAADVSDGAFELYGEASAGDSPDLAFALEPVQPNPARGPATFRFSVPRAAPVRLSLVDLQGREIAVLAEGMRAAGRHSVQWSGRAGRGEVPVGLYLVRMVSPAGSSFRKLAIIR